MQELFVINKLHIGGGHQALTSRREIGVIISYLEGLNEFSVETKCLNNVVVKCVYLFFSNLYLREA